MSPEDEQVTAIPVNQSSGNPLLKGGGLIILFIGLIALNMSVVTIQPGMRGVVTHFGKVQDKVLGEGLHFVLPVVTKVHLMSVRIQKSELKGSAASKDLQQVNAVIAVNWKLKDEHINKLYQEVGSIPRLVLTILQPAVTEVFKATTAKFSAEEILTKRVEVKTMVDESLKVRLAKYQIEVTDVSIVDIGFSVEFNRSIENKQIAEQSAKQAKYLAQKADMLANAEINRARGKSEAQKLLKATLTKEVLQLQSIEKWDGHFPRVMSSKGTLPFIDLAQLQNSGRK